MTESLALPQNCQPDRQLEERLCDLEMQLMDSCFRRQRDRVAELLADDFREFGSSGRVWTKAGILDLLVAEAAPPVTRVIDFAIRPIAPHAVLVTYRTSREDSESLRSSLWILTDSGWKMLFHQGTKV